VSLSLPAGASNTPRTVLEHIKGEEVTQRLTEALELDPGLHLPGDRADRG
jgi:hypothetical protein